MTRTGVRYRGEPGEGGPSRLEAAVERAVDRAATAEAVVLVEGPSDRAAVEAVARLGGGDLRDDGVEVVVIGGATNIGHYLERLGPLSDRLTLAGLCDAAEERYVAGGLERAGFGRGLDRDDLADLGFFVCVEDLEDELIRALGIARVETVLAEQRELDSFRLFQSQPAQRDRPVTAQLRRFLGTRSMRKIRYGELLAERLDPAAVPPPLGGLLARVRARPGEPAYGRQEGAPDPE